MRSSASELNKQATCRFFETTMDKKVNHCFRSLARRLGRMLVFLNSPSAVVFAIVKVSRMCWVRISGWICEVVNGVESCKSVLHIHQRRRTDMSTHDRLRFFPSVRFIALRSRRCLLSAGAWSISPVTFRGSARRCRSTLQLLHSGPRE